MKTRNIFAAFAITAALAALAFAHNKLIKTEPASGATLKTSPAHVEIWFEEKPDPAVSKIDVKGPAGAVPMAAPQAGKDKSIVSDFKGTLPGGAYTVTWQTAGDDGHMSKGTFSFSVAR
jgi:methionine-rich copper-binding protein CopC